MAAAATPQPTFPQDIERAINEVLLSDTRDMCSTMSLVALRFSVCWDYDWMRRIQDCFLPNAGLIRILVLDLAFSQRFVRSQLTEDQFSLVRQLLEASERVRHLAVTWNIWAHLQRKCGALRLQSLYLIWDNAWDVQPPTLEHLQHPSTLEDLTLYTPHDLCDPHGFRPFGRLYLPATTHCVNLAYVTYAADRMAGSFAHARLKGAILALVGAEELDEWAIESIWRERRQYPVFSTVDIPSTEELLKEWVAKMEGRGSVLENRPHRIVGRVQEEEEYIGSELELDFVAFGMNCKLFRKPGSSSNKNMEVRR
ncbi:hypothetical protein DFH07DRAFT_772471 [Mycena maculata]|uniref:Uncharacterized protein n=1 Tax=Mycena maculata TaxID=230809 RepID=A0AAD7J9L9_9AGAR|nr:hypothetical protein DFH07DRAFT_772471 [Mycena maculata]